MKNIALIRNSNSYDIGGAEIFPINLGKILSEQGHKPILLSSNAATLSMAEKAKLSSARSPWLSFQNFSGISIIFFPFYLLWMAYTSLWYLAFIVRNRIDVMHPQSRDDFVGATVAARIARKKVIWIDHADLKHIYMNHRVWYKNPVGKLVYLTSRFANRIIIESHSEKKLIEKSLGKSLPKNYGVTHIGVVDSCTPKVRNKGPITLVSTSRLVIDKGIAELIEAMRLINSPDIRLKICGDGTDAKHFRTLAKDINNIEFMGHISNVVGILQSADILVHPTYHEGFGLSLVEAEMCGLPIIASNVGSIPEIVSDNISGILVPPKDVIALASAIEGLTSDHELRKTMGKAGRRIYLENFQFDQIVKEHFIPLYNDTYEDTR